jgi:hypothetical protein
MSLNTMTQLKAPAMTDQSEIRQRVDDWALFRDAGAWDRLATVWHPEGIMMTTWCAASAVEFMALSRRGFEAGVKVLHTLGGSTIDIEGDRAIAQTKMSILQRGPVDGVEVDVICNGRFWDAFEKHDGRWTIYFRQPIYEMDHMFPLDPAAKLELDPDRLAAFPEGYRHLAYLQSGLGMDVRKNLPGTRGPEVEALYARGARWLAGDDRSCLADPGHA